MIAPSVAPICGIRSQTATTTASANGYARPTIMANTHVLSPGQHRDRQRAHHVRADLREDLVGEQPDPVPPGAGTSAYPVSLIRSNDGHEVDGQHQHGEHVEDRAEQQLGAADHAAERVADGAGVRGVLHLVARCRIARSGR